MDQDLRDHICRIVRGVVVESYGEKTCVATVKVLSDVLLTAWGITATPHVVSLRIVPPNVVEIIERTGLSEQQKLHLVEQLPVGEQAKTIESTADKMKFHMVGLSESGDDFVLWDPSIDQVNSNFDSLRLRPMSLQMSRRKSDANGNIVFRHEGCHLIYKEQKMLEETVFSSEVWLTNYNALATKALEQCSKKLRG